MLFEGLDRIKRSAIMTTIILMIVGNILLVLPESILPFFNEVMGFALLVVAVVSAFQFLSSRRALIHYIYLTLGLLCGVLGICLLVFEGLLTRILIWMVCVFPILSGLYGIYHALVFARRSGQKGWWTLIVLSFALIVFGGFVFYNPWMESTVGTMRIIGGTLMYTALVSGLRLIWLWPVHNQKGGKNT